MTIQTLARQKLAHCEIARLLGITEGAVRYQLRRMAAGAVDGRSAQPMRAEAVTEAIALWREQNSDLALNLAALHVWLVSEHGYRLRTCPSRSGPAPSPTMRP